tara:strand:+ start:2329 stop:2538 length:210 start_codon:yes stop_codon:yes gene_type:complete
VKKNEQDILLQESELEDKQNLYSDSYKTTNVNILLNRVRLDKKKSLRKKIIIFFTLVLIIAAITTYFKI